MSHKPVLRPHRFPPLAQVHAREQLVSRDPAQLQAALAEGFQEGLSKGYEEGHASGLSSGQADARQAAQQQGHADGYAAGRGEALSRIEGPLRTAEALTQHLQQVQHDYQAALRREMVELVERVARQVIRAELTLHPTQLLALVDETLAAMPPARDGVEVFLNPQDLERLIELAPERLKPWRLHPDATLEGGECRVVAGGREADAGCRQRLAACMEQVSGQLVDEATLTGFTDLGQGAAAADVEPVAAAEQPVKTARNARTAVPRKSVTKPAAKSTKTRLEAPAGETQP